MRVRAQSLLGLLVGGSLLLAACGEAAPSSSSPAAAAPIASKPAVTSASASTTSAASPSAKPATGSPHGTTLVYNIGDEPASIDPALDETTTADFVDVQLNATLVQPDKDLNIKAGLAEKWDISADGLTYTFHLRQGLKWSDGSPLTAKDFDYTFKRIFDPATASPYTDFVSGIKGGKDYFASKSKDPAELAKLRDAVGVKATDDNTFVITLIQPQAFFLSTLINGATSPVNQASLEKNKDKAFESPNFVGSGPFLLKNWAHKSKIELAPNPNYYAGAPKIDLQFVMIPETTATLAAYKNNEIDTDGGVGPSAADVSAIQSDPQLAKELSKYTELGTYYLQYNTSKKPFDNVKLRQALGYAMDRQTLIDKVLAGQGDPATSLIPPGMPGHIDGLGPTYDVNKAKALLAEAGFPDGKGLPQNIPASFNNLSVWPLVMQFVQAQLQTIGVSIQLDPRESKTYFNNMRQDASPIFRSGWNSDYPDPDDWYRVIFTTGASQNYGKWSNSQYDDVVKQAAVELDQTKRLALYKQAADIMVNDPPATWWYYPSGFRLFKPWVKGIVTSGQDGGLPGKYFLKDVTIGTA